MQIYALVLILYNIVYSMYTHDAVHRMLFVKTVSMYIYCILYSVYIERRDFTKWR